MGVALAVCSLFPLWIAVAQGDRRLFLAFGCLLLFAIPWVRRATWTFDAATQTLRWIGLRYLRTRTGSMPFSDVRGIDIQSTQDPRSSVTIYRLALVTPQGTLPMSDVYSSGENRCTSVREAILRFLKLDAASAGASMATDFEAYLRSMVQQGRRIDAIEQLRSFQQLPLEEATERIDAIEESLKPVAR